MDHLVKIVSKICPDSKIAQGLACGRTMATSIVKYVLGEHGFDTLRQHLRNVKFSLIVDESTDRKCEKDMCMMVRSYRDDNIKDDFLGLIKLSSADALTLYNHIVEYFTSNDIPYKQNLIGFASDGANVLLGHQHSVMSLLKKDIPALYVMKCICHSFHLCASYACQKLPRFVEDLTRDVYNYFSSSPKRTSPNQTKPIKFYILPKHVGSLFILLYPGFLNSTELFSYILQMVSAKKLRDTTTK